MSAAGNDGESENATKSDADATNCSDIKTQAESSANNDTNSEVVNTAKGNESENTTTAATKDSKAENDASNNETKSEHAAICAATEMAIDTKVENTITCADAEMANDTEVKAVDTCTDIEMVNAAEVKNTTICNDIETEIVVSESETIKAVVCSETSTEEILTTCNEAEKAVDTERENDTIFHNTDMELESETSGICVDNVAANVTVEVNDEGGNSSDDDKVPRPMHLREVVLNTRKPLVLRKFQPPWACFDYSLKEWCRKFDAATDDMAMFELMTCDDGNKSPHWERKREPLKLTAVEFLYEQDIDKEYWIGLNYKRASEFPATVRADVDFCCFGFAGVADDCNYWLSTKKANTPCHYDTYGCNVVVQVYGRKSWLLFPPGTPLTTTRIPYEESSVYCLENFYAPNPIEMKQLLKLQEYAHRVILEPGDVLIVPRHWWHYVESMEISLSVNYWVPLELDVDAQTEECIVKYLIERFVKGERREVLKYVLNPNQLEQITDESELFTILKFLYTNSTSDEPDSKFKKLKKSRHAYQYLDENQLEDVLKLLPENCISEVPHLPADEFHALLMENSKRLYSLSTETELPPFNSIKRALINSICSPEVIKCIKDQFFRRYNNEIL